MDQDPFPPATGPIAFDLHPCTLGDDVFDNVSMLREQVF